MGQKPNVNVVGAGVIGLATAVRLLEAGIDVEVICDRAIHRTTSNVAAGLWYPYKVDGTRVPTWALETLEVYRDMAGRADSGILCAPCTSYIPIDEPRPFWADAEVNYREFWSDDEFTNGKALTATLPIANPSLFLPWLVQKITDLGGVFDVKIGESVSSLGDLDSRVIVNCTGLGAKNLCKDDSMRPIRGVVAIIEHSGIEETITDERNEHEPTYLIPNGKYCVLGGSADEGREDLDITEEEVHAIVSRCSRLDRRVKLGTLVETRVGLRPARPEVRLETEELESGTVVVHNYGHGGSGFTLAWGCASEAADRVKEIL